MGHDAGETTLMGTEFFSTRSAGRTSLSEAVASGLAPDGGLYLPDHWPAVDPASIANPDSLAEVGLAALQDFFLGDDLASELPAICREAFNFPAPLVAVGSEKLFALELFAGPTAAFKDFGARFLAQCMQRIKGGRGGRATILVATSGDTGGAVAAAFHARPWARVIVLYPRGQVSERQERQLTCWGGNVAAMRVRGSFDDCQRMVKEAFGRSDWRATFGLTSANSINIGRLLPQIVYYAASSVALFRKFGERASYIVPSGNLGNATAAVAARSMGLPIDRIVLAHNANAAVPEFLASGVWEPRQSLTTLASAMDVGNPSNMERLRTLFPAIDELRREISATSIDDAAIQSRIAMDYRDYGRAWCPHSAVAAETYARLPRQERERLWVIAATAHPAKFNEIVEPLIGAQVPVPEPLRLLLSRHSHWIDAEPTLDALLNVLQEPGAAARRARA